LAALTELLGANYLLTSDLASMPVLVRLHGNELDPGAADEVEAARHRVMTMLSGNAAPEEVSVPPPRDGLGGAQPSTAMGLLRRRLAHIEHAAEKVARLARRPVIEEGN